MFSLLRLILTIKNSSIDFKFILSFIIEYNKQLSTIFKKEIILEPQNFNVKYSIFESYNF